MKPISRSRPSDPDPRPTILLLGNYRPAVVVARALAKRGHRIILGSRGEEHGCRHSKFVHEVWDHPDLEHARSFCRSLLKFLQERRDIGLVFPITEEFVNFFATRKPSLGEHVTLVSPPAHTIQTFSNKTRALKLAADNGVATHPFALTTDHSGLMRHAGQIGYPLTIRPLGTTARLNNKKALILANEYELQTVLPAWPEGHKALLLQRFASGNRHNVYFAAEDGRVIAVSQSRITRTNQPDGTGLAVDGCTVPVSPDLLKDTQALVAASNYTGIGLAQFIFEPQTGDRCFLELNPRVSGSHAVPEHAGVPLSALAVQLAAGSAPRTQCTSPDACIRGKPGIRYVWTSGDLHGAKMARINREISTFGLFAWVSRALLCMVRADAHMIWSLNDPKPGIFAVVSILPRLKRLRDFPRKALFANRASKLHG